MAGYLASIAGASSAEDSFQLRLLKLPDTSAYHCSSPISEAEESLSLLYNALPQMLRRRIPKIRSLRASIYPGPKTYPRSSSGSSNSSVTSSDSESPPPSYHSRQSSSHSSAYSDSDDDTPELFTSAPSSRPSSSGAATPAPLLPAFTARQDESIPTALSNKSGQHGLALLNISMQNQACHNNPLNRRLYIDGISYILRGLPTDLTAEETTVLRAATPPTLLPEPSTQPHQQEPTSSEANPKTEPPTVLRRAISTLTFYTLLLLALVLPYFQALLTTLQALDARHRVSTRMFEQSTILLRLLAAQALALAALAWDAGDGALRHSCRDFGVWVLKDVCGGLDEGVGRAVGELRLAGNKR